MNTCIVRAHKAGLGSLINNVITYFGKYDCVCPDWTGSIYGEGDLWPVLFCPFRPPDPPFDVVQGYIDQTMTYKNAGKLYQSGDQWRRECNRHWQRITIHSWLRQEAVECVSPLHNRKFTAVLVRANSHAGEQITNRSQSLDEYAAAIEKAGNEYVYAACSDEESRAWLKQRFTVISHPHTKRSKDRDVDRHLVEKQTWWDAVNALEEILIMSMANTLIHPISNMATCALYISTSLKSVYLP